MPESAQRILAFAPQPHSSSMPPFPRVFSTLWAIFKNRKTPPTWFVLCVPALVNVCFGLYPVAVKMFASGTPEKANAYIFTLYRGIGGASVLFLISYSLEGAIQIPDLRTTLAFATFGFFVVFLGQSLYITGLYYVGPDISATIQPLLAIWTAFISVLCCVEKVPSFCMLHTYCKIFGMVIAVVGAANVISGEMPEGDKGQQVIGCTALVLDTIVGAIYYVLQKKWIYNKEGCIWRDYPVAMTAYTYSFGSLFIALGCLYYVFTGQADQFLLPRQSLPALLFAIFVISAFCYFLITWSNKYIPSSVMTAFWPVQVLVTGITAFLFFGDKLTLRQCLGGFGIILGLAMVLYSNHVDEKMAQGGKGIPVPVDQCCKHTSVRSS